MYVQLFHSDDDMPEFDCFQHVLLTSDNNLYRDT